MKSCNKKSNSSLTRDTHTHTNRKTDKIPTT